MISQAIDLCIVRYKMHVLLFFFVYFCSEMNHYLYQERSIQTSQIAEYVFLPINPVVCPLVPSWKQPRHPWTRWSYGEIEDLLGDYQTWCSIKLFPQECNVLTAANSLLKLVFTELKTKSLIFRKLGLVL